MLIHSKYARNKNIWALSLYPVDMYLLLQVFNTAYTYSSGHVYGLSYFGTIPQLVKLYFQAIKSSESFMTLSIWSWVYIYVVSSFWVHVITASPCQASFNDTSNSPNGPNKAEESAYTQEDRHTLAFYTQGYLATLYRLNQYVYAKYTLTIYMLVSLRNYVQII